MCLLIARHEFRQVIAIDLSVKQEYASPTSQNPLWKLSSV